MPVGIGDGHTVTLSDVADFRMASGAINISRENAQRVKAVSIFIAGRDMGSVVADMRKRVDASVQLPEGYRLEWSRSISICSCGNDPSRSMKALSTPSTPRTWPRIACACWFNTSRSWR